MFDWKYQSELCDTVYYKKGSKDLYQTVAFNKNIQTVDISQTVFVRNNEPMLANQGSDTKYSSKYGHFQTQTPCLTLKDINWIQQKGNELFS